MQLSEDLNSSKGQANGGLWFGNLNDKTAKLSSLLSDLPFFSPCFNNTIISLESGLLSF